MIIISCVLLHPMLAGSLALGAVGSDTQVSVWDWFAGAPFEPLNNGWAPESVHSPWNGQRLSGLLAWASPALYCCARLKYTCYSPRIDSF